MGLDSFRTQSRVPSFLNDRFSALTRENECHYSGSGDWSCELLFHLSTQPHWIKSRIVALDWPSVRRLLSSPRSHWCSMLFLAAEQIWAFSPRPTMLSSSTKKCLSPIEPALAFWLAISKGTMAVVMSWLITPESSTTTRTSQQPSEEKHWMSTIEARLR